MIDITMNGGDLAVSKHGDLLLHLSDVDNIIQMANSAIHTIKGENIFHREYGNDAWNKRLKVSDTGLEVIRTCAKDAILHAINEVVEVTTITANRGDTNSECIIDYTLLTIDGRSISSSTGINIL